VPGGTATFSSRTRLSSDRLALRRHWNAPVVAVLVGGTLTGLVLLLGWWAPWATSTDRVLPSIALGAALVFWAWLLRYATTAPRFDKRAGVFVIPRAPLLKPHRVSLRQVHAVQLLRELCEDVDGRQFHSYEINLVLHGGDRVHVIDHPSLDDMLELADQVARFVGVPVWDAPDVDAPTTKPGWFVRASLGLLRILAR